MAFRLDAFLLCIIALPLSGQASDIMVRPLRYAVCDAGRPALADGRKPPSAALVGTYRAAIDTTIIYIAGDFKARGGRVIRRLHPVVIEGGRLPSDSAILILPLKARPTLFATEGPWPVTLLLPDSTSRPIPPAERSRYGPPVIDGLVSIIVRVPPESFQVLVASRAARLAVASDTIRLDGKLLDGIRVLYLASRCGWRNASAG